MPSPDDHDHDHIGRLLDEWRGESPELDTTPIALAGRILRAARYLERGIATELAQHGLNIAEFNALSALRRGGPPFRLTPSELSHQLLFTSGGLTKLLERLERARLVRRDPADDDRRVIFVSLTEAGRTRQEEAMLAHLRNEEELLGALDGTEQRALASGLAGLLLSLERRERHRSPPLRAVARQAAS